jgi:integrase
MKDLGIFAFQSLIESASSNSEESALDGAGPVTVGIDLGYIKTILSHAAAVHGIVVSTEPIDLARITLRRLGLVGKGDERDRRPPQDELNRIVSTLEANVRQQIPVGRIVRFAVATAMRQDEIARVEWRDFDASGRMLLIRNRKDPRKKKGNDSEFLYWMYQAMTLARSSRSKDGSRIFAKAGFFHTTDDPSEQHFVGSAGV